MPRTVTVGAAQLGPIARTDSRAQAVSRMIALLRQAASHGCDLVVFPECALTAFFPHWWYERQEDVDALLKSDSALARNLLNEKKIIEDSGVPATIRIAHGLVIDQILAEIVRGNHDLVVAGSWAIRDRWRTYAIGNITREIVNRTDRPVLVMRSDKKPKSLANELRRMVAKFGPRPD